MDISKKHLRVSMSDGTKWYVPVMAIARNRAEFYKDEFGGDVEKSLQEDTLPLFEDSSFEITDWAAGNMNWDDVSSVATLAEASLIPADYQEGWVNGDKKIVEKP